MNALRYYIIAAKLKPYIDKLQAIFKKENGQPMTISKWTNIFTQVVGLAVQAVNQFGSVIPVKFQGAVTLVVSIAQLIAAYLGHNSTPAGNAIVTDPVTKKESIQIQG